MLSRPNHDFSEVESVFKQVWRECGMRIFPFRTFRLFWEYPDASSSSWMLLFLFHFPKLLEIVTWFVVHLLISAGRTGIPYVGHMSGSHSANFMENAVKLPGMQSTSHPSNHLAVKPHSDLMLWFMVNPNQLSAVP